MGIYSLPRRAFPAFPDNSASGVCNFSTNVSRETYGAHIEAIRNHIAAGDVYQITYCIKFRFTVKGDSLALYPALLRIQPVPYPAFIRTGDYSIISLSPERFLVKRGSRVVTEPMKGTWPRGKTLVADLIARQRFLARLQKPG